MNVALIYGGRSAEHEVSIMSAKTIERLLIEGNHTVLLIAIDRRGRWFLQEHLTDEIDQSTPLYIIPADGIYTHHTKLAIDVAFPTTHGWGGEDGNLQGLLTLARIPFAGCDTAASAVGMHKALAQTLFEKAGIPTIPTLVFTSSAIADEEFLHIGTTLGRNLFVKPENAGSSVGVTALDNPTPQVLASALEKALAYSERALIQPYYKNVIEVECAVFEDAKGELHATDIGVVVNPTSEAFLSYAQKYAQSGGAYLLLPSILDQETEDKIKTLALRGFEAIKGGGYARVDFFLVDNKPILNEINTLPGLTATSHWPKLITFAGFDLLSVIEDLLVGAINKFNRIWQLRTSYE